MKPIAVILSRYTVLDSSSIHELFLAILSFNKNDGKNIIFATQLI